MGALGRAMFRYSSCERINHIELHCNKQRLSDRYRQRLLSTQHYMPRCNRKFICVIFLTIQRYIPTCNRLYIYIYMNVPSEHPASYFQLQQAIFMDVSSEHPPVYSQLRQSIYLSVPSSFFYLLIRSFRICPCSGFKTHKINRKAKCQNYTFLNQLPQIIAIIYEKLANKVNIYVYKLLKRKVATDVMLEHFSNCGSCLLLLQF